MVFRLFRSKLSSLQLPHLFYFIVFLCLILVSVNSYKKIIKFDVPKENLEEPRSRYDSCLLKSDNKNEIYPSYYRHATSARNSSYPFISGDTYRAFADYVFDETKHDNLTSVKPGDVVFVKADEFDAFFNSPYTSIKHPFVLVTHNSDFYAPRAFEKYLNEQKIITWYASNPSLKNHPKLVPIPIGLANARWPHGNITKLMNAYIHHRKPWAERTTLIYANFNVRTSHEGRKKALDSISKFNKAKIIREPVSFDTYLRDIGDTKFVLSPPGNGLDCHRTWESIIMGAAPIVLSSTLDPLFQNVPSVIVNQWTSITEELLSSLNFTSYDNAVPNVCCARYWYERLLKHRNIS